MEPAAAAMTKAAYARYAGLSKGRVTQLTKPGELLHKALTPEKLIDVRLAEKLRGRSYDPANAMAKPPRSLTLPSNGDDVDDDDFGDEDAALLRRSRGRIAEADADFKHMRNLERAGQLVDKAAFAGRQKDRLKALFDAVRSAKRDVVDRLISESLIAADQQDDVRLAVGEEIEKVIADWRKGIKDPTDA